jgi:hypothetical protein
VILSDDADAASAMGSLTEEGVILDPATIAVP